MTKKPPPNEDGFFVVMIKSLLPFVGVELDFDGLVWELARFFPNCLLHIIGGFWSPPLFTRVFIRIANEGLDSSLVARLDYLVHCLRTDDRIGYGIEIGGFVNRLHYAWFVEGQTRTCRLRESTVDFLPQAQFIHGLGRKVVPKMLYIQDRPSIFHRGQYRWKFLVLDTSTIIVTNPVRGIAIAVAAKSNGFAVDASKSETSM